MNEILVSSSPQKGFALHQCVFCGVMPTQVLRVRIDNGPRVFPPTTTFAYYVPCGHAPYVEQERQLTKEQIAVALLMADEP